MPQKNIDIPSIIPAIIVVESLLYFKLLCLDVSNAIIDEILLYTPPKVKPIISTKI